MEIFGIILEENIVLLAEALILIIFGILISFIVGKLLLKFVDSNALKKLFGKDVSTYEASIKISKIICWIVQFSILLLFVDYAFVLLNWDLISNVFSYIIADIPKISFFILIILAGFLIAKIAAGQIKKKNIHKTT